MICAQCGHEMVWSEDAEPCRECAADPRLEMRYRLDAVLGRGGAGVTFRATRLADGLGVCVKELAYHRMQSFEAEKLFRRESEVLRQLEHPQIPKHLDFFTVTSGKTLSLFIVQELIEGRSLEEERASHRYAEDELVELIDGLLSILEYLQSLRPPVIHRDIKPGNVMRRASDGALALVDFGAVRDAVMDPAGGSTVAGTFGYMAPEQFSGKASPRSDLYSVGVLGVVLLSRKDPIEMTDDRHRLDWRPHVVASPAMLGFLDRLLQTQPEGRPEDATAARALLRAVGDAPSIVEPQIASAQASPPLALLQTQARVLWPAWLMAGLSIVGLISFVLYLELSDEEPQEDSYHEMRATQRECRAITQRLNHDFGLGVQGIAYNSHPSDRTNEILSDFDAFLSRADGCPREKELYTTLLDRYGLNALENTWYSSAIRIDDFLKQKLDKHDGETSKIRALAEREKTFQGRLIQASEVAASGDVEACQRAASDIAMIAQQGHPDHSGAAFDAVEARIEACVAGK